MRVGTRRPRAPADRGAAAVEFALVMPLLFVVLFGIVQYGYGLFQLQALHATVADASAAAARGLQDCAVFTDQVRDVAENNGLDRDAVTGVTVEWQAADGTVLGAAQRYEYASVTVDYTPFRIGFPLVPFPTTLTRTGTSAITDVAPGSVTGC